VRIAKVIGTVVLDVRLKELPAARYLIVRPQDRQALQGQGEGADETVVMYDDLGANLGDLVGLVEGREATAPFYPAHVPYDAYNAAILDAVEFAPAPKQK
jgi:microcompartment protein CcmK/EutM